MLLKYLKLLRHILFINTWKKLSREIISANRKRSWRIWGKYSGKYIVVNKTPCAYEKSSCETGSCSLSLHNKDQNNRINWCLVPNPSNIPITSRFPGLSSVANMYTPFSWRKFSFGLKGSKNLSAHKQNCKAVCLWKQ